MKSNNRTTVRSYPSFIEIARRAQIVGCAIDAIAELGFAKASLDQIALRAGVSKGVISYHFATKDELIRQVVTEVFDAGRQFMEPRILAATTATDRLRTYIESNLAFMATHRKQLAALLDIAANARTANGSPVIGAAFFAPRLQGTMDLLRAGQESGEFRAFDRRVMALTLIHAIDGIPPLMAAEPTLDLAAHAAELTMIFVLATRKEMP
jgi:AcrR family transcriptional regulator